MESDENFNYINFFKIGYILNLKELIIFKFFLIFFLMTINFVKINNYNYNKNIKKNNNISDFNKYVFFENKSLPILYNYEYFKISSIKYSFSFKYNIIKVDYSIGFYDKDNNIILPSDISLYKNLSIICNIVLKFNNSIDSLANIYKNTFFNCIEFCEINEKIKFGIKIYRNILYSYIYLFSETIFIYNNLNNHLNVLFEPLLFIEDYLSLIKKVYNKKELDKKLKLNKSFMQYPYYNLKKHIELLDNKWYFKNIYNDYFCFCKGAFCLDNNIDEKCKYLFYLYIIDNNKETHLKTDYLFIDFIFADLSSDDVYPIFEKMIQQNFPVHYITEKKDIYNKYCENIKECLTILPVKKEDNPINSNFLEKYLNVILKLKVVVSGRGTTFNTNLFYNIEYITYISVGHGVCYFKYYLYNYNRIYGIEKNNKILLPPSEKIISIAKHYGWKENDIIKLNLPRWDKYNENYYEKTNNIKTNSIFIMFTWRNIKKNKDISSFYFENIINLINNNLLNENIKKKNITLYLSFHRLINKKSIKAFKRKMLHNQNFQFIQQNEISECLAKTSLVISDFSSVIFDLMYRGKPFIIYMPDGNDPQIEYLYIKEYYDLILLMKNGTIYFENIFFDLDQAINKIIFYINNNYNLELKLKNFYDSFGFKRENSSNKFIDYLKNLK